MRQGSIEVGARQRQLFNEISRNMADRVITGEVEVDEVVSDLVALSGLISDGELMESRENLIELVISSLVLIQSIDRESELHFHRQRRMFYIIGDTLMIAEENDERSHAQWMQEEGDYGSYIESIRGYADYTGLYAYKGSDYILTTPAESDLLSHLPQLVTELNLDADLVVFSGVKPGQIGVRWEGRRKLGKIRDILS